MAMEDPETWNAMEKVIHEAIRAHNEHLPKDKVFEALAERVYRLLIGRKHGDKNLKKEEMVATILGAIHEHLRAVAKEKERCRGKKGEVPSPEKSLTRTIYEALNAKKFFNTGPVGSGLLMGAL